jgi:hypothetical protein
MAGSGLSTLGKDNNNVKVFPKQYLPQGGVAWFYICIAADPVPQDLFLFEAFLRILLSNLEGVEWTEINGCEVKL